MYREIVTKAVIGKGRIIDTGEVKIKVDNEVSKVLGCWVINHYCVCSLEKDKVIAKGKYDLHVWYGFNHDSDTNVHKQTIDYIQEFDIVMKDEEKISVTNEFNINCLKYPTCSGLLLEDDGAISVKVEKELSLDIIGEAKLKVQVDSNEWSDDINNINVDYLNK